MKLSISIEDSVTRAFEQLLPPPMPLLLDAGASLGEEQLRRRVAHDKTDPDGKAWKRWDPAYADTRGPQHSLLISSGQLMDSLVGVGTGAKRRLVGSSVPYAERQHKARGFVGVSDEDERAHSDLLVRGFNAFLSGAWR